MIFRLGRLWVFVNPTEPIMSRQSKPPSRETWIARLQRFQLSSLNVTEFCQREGVSTPSFYHWKKRLRDELSSPRRDDGQFVPVRVAESITSVTVNLPNGTTVEIPASVGRTQFRELLQACLDVAHRLPDSEVRQ